MITINIEVKKLKNIKNYKIDKAFEDITYRDVVEIVKETYPNMKNELIVLGGWYDIEISKKANIEHRKLWNEHQRKHLI